MKDTIIDRLYDMALDDGQTIQDVDCFVDDVIKFFATIQAEFPHIDLRYEIYDIEEVRQLVIRTKFSLGHN